MSRHANVTAAPKINAALRRWRALDFKTSAEFWLNLQQATRPTASRRAHEAPSVEELFGRPVFDDVRMGDEETRHWKCGHAIDRA